MNRFCILIFSTLLIFSCNTTGSKNELILVKKLDHYPSASGIEYYDNRFYVIGDDARYLLVLNMEFNPVDSFIFNEGKEKRMAKDTKLDLESITTTVPLNKTILICLGSGSLAPYRNVALLCNPISRQVDTLRLDSFYIRLNETGIKEINIEGETEIPGLTVHSNRGNKGHPLNHLIFVQKTYSHATANTDIHLTALPAQSDTSFFSGVSGLDYAEKSDRMIMSVSTEDTRNSYDDGPIGKSYLWIIDSISGKTSAGTINPNRIIDLEEIDARFKGQKIESVCIIEENGKYYVLGLAADNDDGSSTLFILKIKKD